MVSGTIFTPKGERTYSEQRPMITFSKRLVWREFPEWTEDFEDYPRNKCHPAMPNQGWVAFVPLLEYHFDIARHFGPQSVMATPRHRWKETLLAVVDSIDETDEHFTIKLVAIESLVRRMQSAKLQLQ